MKSPFSIRNMEWTMYILKNVYVHVHVCIPNLGQIVQALVWLNAEPLHVWRIFSNIVIGIFSSCSLWLLLLSYYCAILRTVLHIHVCVYIHKHKYMHISIDRYMVSYPSSSIHPRDNKPGGALVWPSAAIPVSSKFWAAMERIWHFLSSPAVAQLQCFCII